MVVIILALIAFVASLLLISYRRQIKDICRRAAFLRTQESNMTVSGDLPFPELRELTAEINALAKEKRERLRGSAREEQALKETIANLSHDIRTPLTSLSGYLQLLKQTEDPAEREKYLGIIEERTKSLEELLETLFTYARLQDAGFSPILTDLDLQTVIAPCVLSFYDDFEARGIAVETAFTQEPLPVHAAEESVRRIVQNILKNALDHGTSRALLTLKKENAQVVFSCANEVAHPEEIDIHSVFSRFYRSDAARTHSSTGLGLSIAHQLAEQTGGKITATLDDIIFTVTFTLPLTGEARR
ncbi:MAG: HAMP domain-containing histidine kinase [Lachnospiraceae bacterium]|nr:HAMP domain-containing histidine kinase [Lachnospiraceae bacterium]MBR0164998.1 HAMP domain-containing histidine kinase [Lachnospiraceae bacterium]